MKYVMYTVTVKDSFPILNSLLLLLGRVLEQVRPPDARRAVRGGVGRRPLGQDRHLRDPGAPGRMVDQQGRGTGLET